MNTWYTIVVRIHHSFNVLLKLKRTFLKPKEHIKQVASSPLNSL